MTNLLYGDAVSRTQYGSAGALQGTDVTDVTRGGVELQTTEAARAVLMRKTPALPRTLVLTGANTVQLTLADNDTTVLITGTTGTLSTDGTLTSGFRCGLLNTASGTLTWGAGLSGFASSTGLPTSTRGWVDMIGSTVWVGTGVAGTPSTATSYTTQLLDATALTPITTIVVGNPFKYRLTPVGGVWPAGDVITPTASLAGTIAPTTSTLSANSTPVDITITPSATGTDAINSSATTTTGGALTNATGSSSITVNSAPATSFTTAPISVTVTSGSATNLTSSPNGAWQAGQTYTLTPATVAGTFAAVSGCTVSGTTVTPTVGATAPAVVAFTPSSANGTSGTIAIAGTGITATTTSISASVASANFPSLTSVTRLAVLQADSGVTGTTDITAWQNQLGSDTLGRSVANSASVGATVNGLNSVVFNGTTLATNSGLFTNTGTPPSWIANLAGDSTIALALRTGATIGNGQIFCIAPATYSANAAFELFSFGGTISLRRGSGSANTTIYSFTPVANTLYKLLFAYSASGSVTKVWNNNATSTPSNSPGSTNSTLSSPAIFTLGQLPTAGGSNFGIINVQFLDVRLSQGVISNVEAATEMGSGNGLGRWG